MLTVEALLNLTWMLVAISIVAGIWAGVRSGKIDAPMGKAMTAAVLIAFVLLPVVSISDDIQMLHKLTEPEDGSFRRQHTDGGVELALLCLMVLCAALVLLSETMFALRRLRVLGWSVLRLDTYAALGLPSVVGVRPPPVCGN